MKRNAMLGAVTLLALTATACETGPMDPEPAATAQTAPQYLIDPDVSPTGNLQPEAVFVCKDVVGGPVGATFDFTVTSTRSGLPLFVPATSLSNGQCAMVAQAGGPAFQITVTETPQAGFTLDSIVRYNATFNSGLQPWVASTMDKQVLTSGTSATGEASGGTPLRGALIVFYNRADVPPPPPPGGGEGCTPGYWKQSQHFGSWTGYTPSTLFSDVFDDAFPGMTLLDVVGQGGGGLEALGRHTVAALLNSASAGVSYDVSTADVISAFNAAFASGDYETQKNIFAVFNEQGCPLGRAE